MVKLRVKGILSQGRGGLTLKDVMQGIMLFRARRGTTPEATQLLRILHAESLSSTL